MLERRFSPQQISATLRREHPDDPEMRVAHETIYQSLYVQTRGGLRKELARYLRSGPRQAQAAARADRPGPASPAMVSISERPAEVEDRAVPGHWEGDLLVGKRATARSSPRWWSATPAT